MYSLHLEENCAKANDTVLGSKNELYVPGGAADGSGATIVPILLFPFLSSVIA